MLSQSSLPEAIRTQPSQKEKQQALLIHQLASAPIRITQHLASFFILSSGQFPSADHLENNLKVSWFKKKKRAAVWCRVGCAGAAEESVPQCCQSTASYLGNETKISPRSATPCDIPTHTLLLTFYLPLNSPAGVTFSGFLIYVLQDLKSEGRDFKKISSVDKHL